jgi:hypothetical protein
VYYPRAVRYNLNQNQETTQHHGLWQGTGRVF